MDKLPLSEVEITAENLTMCASPGINQIPNEIIQTGNKTLRHHI
jgi:hypothetical protein